MATTEQQKPKQRLQQLRSKFIIPTQHEKKQVIKQLATKKGYRNLIERRDNKIKQLQKDYNNMKNSIERVLIEDRQQTALSILNLIDRIKKEHRRTKYGSRGEYEYECLEVENEGIEVLASVGLSDNGKSVDIPKEVAQRELEQEKCPICKYLDYVCAEIKKLEGTK